MQGGTWSPGSTSESIDGCHEMGGVAGRPIASGRGSIGLLAWWIGIVVSSIAFGKGTPPPSWVWYPEGDPEQGAPAETRFFRRVLELEAAPTHAVLHITCDNEYRIWLNGVGVDSGAEWGVVNGTDVSKHLRRGPNVIAVEGKNQGGPAGLVVEIALELEGGRKLSIRTGPHWRCSKRAAKGWKGAKFDDSSWLAVHVVKAFGESGLWDNSRWLEPGKRHDYRAPEGFDIREVATHLQTGSVVCFEFDGRGRPLISRERGPILVLDAPDEEGVWREVHTVTDRVTNCQGLCAVGDSIYCVGDGPQGTGAYRLRDTDGDDRADQIELVLKYRGGMGEHGPHAVRYGPDGSLYFVIGNHAFIDSKPSPRSPHRGYGEDQLVETFPDANGHARGIRAPGGTVFRHRIGSRSFELFCGGFRNEYDIAFDSRGEMFTFDSDMEWDVNLPWYRPVRVNHCVPGGEYGWRSGSGKWPAYVFDSLPAIHDVGRGSPTGIAFYHHRQFPPEYRGALFLCDWSMGRILALHLKPEGSTYRAIEEEFITGRPLNCTDVDVGPDGSLYFTTGGRGTKGGLYRVQWTGAEPAPDRELESVAAAFSQPQPLSAWARARVGRLRQRLAARWDSALRRAVFDPALGSQKRVSALWLRRRLGPELEEEELVRLASDPESEVRAAAAVLLGEHRGERTFGAVRKLLDDSAPFVIRRAAEALARRVDRGEARTSGDLGRRALELTGHPDRNVRFAGRLLLERLEPSAWWKQGLESSRPRPKIAALLARARLGPDARTRQEILESVDSLLAEELGIEQRLALTRLIAVVSARGGGLPSPLAGRISRWARAGFPSKDWRLDRELALLMAATGAEGAIDAISTELGRGASRAQQIYYVYCLRLLDRGWTGERVERLFQWFGPALKWKGGHSFHGYVEFLWSAWVKQLSEEDRRRVQKRKVDLAQVRLPVETQPGPGSMSYDEVLAFLRNDPRSRSASRERGKAVFEKAGCSHCHAFGDLGEGAGPELTTVAHRFRREEIVESIFFPSRVISDQYRGLEIVTKSGEAFLGMPVFQDHERLTVVKTDGTRATLKRSEILETSVPEVSVMPEGLLNPLEPGEIADLFAFLMSDCGELPPVNSPKDL